MHNTRMYTHQDWEPVIVKRKSDTASNAKGSGGSKRTDNATYTSSGVPAWKIEKNADEGSGPRKISREDAAWIAQARVKAKLTQDQLAQELRIQAREIKDMEGGKAVENRGLISRVKAFLNKRNAASHPVQS